MEAIFLGDPVCSPITVPDRYTDCSPAGIRAISRPPWSEGGETSLAEGFAVNPSSAAARPVSCISLINKVT